MIRKLSSIPSRFKTAWKNPNARKNAAFMLAGKLLGVVIVLVLMTTIFPITAAHAQSGTPDATAQINAINTSWTLIAAFLVFCMQVGFEFLEAGFARSRESVNILVEGIADTCICGITFWAFGFAFMFCQGTPLIGTTGFFLQGLPTLYGTTGVPVLAFWVFQFAFADTCSTVTSGAMVGRTGFIGDLLYSVGVTGFIYPILGHWSWGPGGILATMQPAGFLDFAGSTVVHTIGGAVSLTGAIVLGPRLGRVFKRDGGGPMPPHNVILGAIGGLILWFGWYGFNPGSTLNAMDIVGIGRVSFNTTLAACSAGMTALIWSYFRTGKKWDLGLSVNGFLAGLVAITCPCYWVDPIGAFFIGIGGTIAMVICMDLLEYFRVDDPIGAVPVHMAAGIWGTISLGLFAAGHGFTGPTGESTATVVNGLFYGGGVTQLIAQIIGSGATTIATLVISFILMYAVNLTGTLRLDPEGEIQGMDLNEHGVLAYPEYVLNPDDGTPKTLEDLKHLKVAGKGAAAAGD